MTEEESHNTDPKYCRDCEQIIRLEGTIDGKYFLKCGCPNQVRVPETWQFRTWE